MADVKSDFHDRDFGLKLGVSYVISQTVSASLRYYVGFTNVTSTKTKNFNRAF